MATNYQVKFREYICPCGAGTHTVNIAAEPYKTMAKFIKDLGVNITVEVQGKRYSVPRIYIAKHGLSGWEVIKFPEVKE